MSAGIALLCCADASSAAVANALERAFGEVAVLVEERESRSKFLRRRINRLGFATVAGQLAFMALVPLLRRFSRTRLADIIREGGLDCDRRLLDAGTSVPSVNEPEAVDWLRRQRPEVVVINGTRIIARHVLEAVQAPFVNMHCGITPRYRGVHGGYWALSCGDPEHCGVTVHLVDPGVDTGDIVAQRRIHPEPGDNFATYPYLQLAAGLPLLVEAVRAAREGRLDPRRDSGKSRQWYHPTLLEYLRNGLGRGVW